jgi:EmrB/QacA subfamily drug resistance transporter
MTAARPADSIAGMTTTLSATGETGTRGNGRHLGLALVVIAAAQLMVALDSTIVTVALPHIQTALHFTGSGLEWVVNAYALTLGGLMLLGGRVGDLLGRRRMFITGLLLFSAASLAGGLATSAAWLLAARAVQGVGGAIVAPAALALIATTFAEGPARSRAMGVYAAMSVVGGTAGLLAGGVLVTYARWQWVLFVNVPIGIAAALAAPAVLPSAPRRTGGRFDLPGAITGTAGVTALVYGLTSAAPTGANGGSNWGDGQVVASLAASVVLLAAFAVIETRSRHALLPVRLLRSRDRVGANLIILAVGTAMFGVFFFLTLFVQDVWGYSPLRTGVMFLPVTVVMLVASLTAAALVPRVGARPLLLAGGVAVAGGLYWLSRVTEHGSYVGGLLGPGLVTGVAFGLLIVPTTLVGLSRVPEGDSGAAGGLLNAGRQLGGSIGLAVLGTVAWTVVANSARAQAAAAARAGARVTAAASHAAYQHALATGFDRAFLVGAAIAVLIIVVAGTTIRIRRADLAGR